MYTTNGNDAAEGKQTENDDSFSDALEDFEFCDSTLAPDHQSDQSTSSSTSSSYSPETSSPATTLRHRSVSRLEKKGTPAESSHVDPKTRFKERRPEICRQLEGNEEDSGKSDRVDSSRVDSVGGVTSVGEGKEEDMGKSSRVDSSLGDSVREVTSVGEGEENEGSTVTIGKDDHGGDSAGGLGADSASMGFLVYIAALLVKAIGFQFNLFVTFVSFPVWVLYNSYMLVVDPFGVVKRSRGFLAGKLVSLRNLALGIVSPLVGDWLKENEMPWKLVLRFGWGLFSAIYVGSILCGLLVFSIMVSLFFMRNLVEKPLHMREDLNFDYTKNSPVAYVPIRSCGSVGCGVECNVNDGDLWSSLPRFIPPYHKLQVTISLVLPESDYNRNLGMFQVRVEFLSADGKTLYTKSRPCMLKFKSQPVRVLAMFLKAAPLVTGYVSESETLQLKIKGITEGEVPTSCLKVTIEQRAEFHAGAGIPEVYDASLTLESELPCLKRIIWYWKKTLFVWITIVSFVIELLFTLVCCRALIISRVRGREHSPINSLVQSDAQQSS